MRPTRNSDAPRTFFRKARGRDHEPRRSATASGSTGTPGRFNRVLGPRVSVAGMLEHVASMCPLPSPQSPPSPWTLRREAKKDGKEQKGPRKRAGSSRRAGGAWDPLRAPRTGRTQRTEGARGGAKKRRLFLNGRGYNASHVASPWAFSQSPGVPLVRWWAVGAPCTGATL